MPLLKSCCCFIILCILTCAAYGADCDSYRGLSKPTRICWDDEHKAYVSSTCLKKKASCEALTFLKKNQPIKLPVRLLTQGNPAVAACLYLKREVEVLADSDGNQVSFCLFEDGSLIDVNALERLTL